MKNCETACCAICAAIRCTIVGLDGLNKEAAELAAKIQGNFEELGI